MCRSGYRQGAATGVDLDRGDSPKVFNLQFKDLSSAQGNTLTAYQTCEHGQLLRLLVFRNT
jgi:hypothetical protein